MSRRRRDYLLGLLGVGGFVVGFVVLVSLVGLVGFVGFVVFVIVFSFSVGSRRLGGLVGGLVGLGGLVLVVGLVAGSCVAIVRRRFQSSRELARLGIVPPLTTRSLRWVGVLLPGEEGSRWLAEVTSCLAETPDPGERRRYVRSYRRAAPRLIWVSWTEYLRESRHRELS